MSQVRASSHEYTHVERIKNLREENFKGTVAHNCHGKRINFTAKTMTSRQKEKHYDKRKKTHDKKNNQNLTAKEKRIKMSFRHRINFAVSLFLFAVRFSFCRESFSFCREVFLFTVRLFSLPLVRFFLP